MTRHQKKQQPLSVDTGHEVSVKIQRGSFVPIESYVGCFMKVLQPNRPLWGWLVVWYRKIELELKKLVLIG